MVHLLLVKAATKCFGLMHDNDLADLEAEHKFFVVPNGSYSHTICGAFKVLGTNLNVCRRMVLN